MNRMMQRAGRMSLAAFTVAALGFGGAQAVASPAPATGAPPVCNPQVCNRICQAIPGSIGGFCTPDGGCSCYIGG
ncbi:MAG TPA: hypothetical protein VFY65_14125 [Longimicrobium sp.]|nr:hypothetical protein [Longimicrobium sp.]